MAFGDAGIMRWSPIVEGHVGTGCQVVPFYRSRSCSNPSDVVDSVPLPDRVENTRPGPAIGIDRGNTRPYDLVSHLDECWAYLRKIIHRVIVPFGKRRNHKKR